MMKKYERIFKEFIEMRKDWEGAFALDPLYLTISYKLVSGSHDGGFIFDVSDLMTIYDNLAINSEFIDDENFDEYDFKTLERNWGITPQKYKVMKTNIFKNKCIYLMNYFKVIHKNDKTLTELIWCCKKFDTSNLLFDEQFNFIGFGK